MNAEEKKIITAIIMKAIANGCVITVHDGEAKPVKDSRNMTEILRNLGHCEEEWLYFKDKETGSKIGHIYLVYGNEPDEVVCDYGWEETSSGGVVTASMEGRMKILAEAGTKKPPQEYAQEDIPQ